VIVAPSCGLGLAGPKYGGVLGNAAFQTSPSPVRSTKVRATARYATRTNSYKVEVSCPSLRMAMPKEVAALIVEAASHPQ